MYSKLRSGDNQPGCKSLTCSRCRITSNFMCNITTLAANAATTGIGTWTIVSGAGGSFVNANSATTVFNGVSGTTYDLQWTISNGVCPSTSDNVTIQFTTPPTVATAGSDQTLCSTSAILAGNTPTTGTGQWTVVSGAGGSFVLNTNPTTTFNGTAGVTYVLQWTISNGVCTASSDQVTIKLDQNPLPVADAGSPQTLCATINNLSSQCSDDRYRHLDDREWSRRKLCQCQQCDHSI